ncbi:thiol:disulfide interchange protein DsbC [Mariprofundus ferrinatatus]|uniref:Thiol:disulfide interchange protein n=1 Tax=Mariprofundus ferrinatatus TaxID=1921087 RepID=A0A2K8L8G2_9PROT|nr:DsbC family protein [Mariprofundus ferrinatatus]ATX81224.1 thiol:disulfide interchange protein DsbC [Mariprofundus ferrinatatus]
MRLFLLLISFLVPAAASAAAGNADIHAIAQKSAELLHVERVDEVRKTQIEGLFEVRSGRNIFYSDAQGKYFVLGGSLIDTAAGKNLTSERKEQINRIDWSELPLDKAILSGDRGAKLKLAIFTDPDCPYCRKLEKELVDLKGVAVYTFLYPLEKLHPNARAKSEAIWCSKEQHSMLQKVMLERFVPEAARCKTPIDDIQTLAQRLNINGTPTFIAGDGRMASGVKSAADMKTWLENGMQKD